VIQIAALNGQMTPTVQTAGQDWQFNMLGISMRGWGGFGVSRRTSAAGSSPPGRNPAAAERHGNTTAF
jgi:hypothetical protein